MKERSIRILGTRGVPAAHGGFETFAEYLALYLVRHGWQVTVYCQDDKAGPEYEDDWEGVHRVHIPVTRQGPLGTIIFDWKSTLHASNKKELILTLGYNTALFCAIYRMKGLTNLINMDGIEWQRAKWSRPIRIWFWLNERLGCLLGNHLVADNPGIMNHLATRVPAEKITMIPYGAKKVDGADVAALANFNLEPSKFITIVARPEPENSILEMVKAFSRKKRGVKLVVLGRYDASHAYQKKVMDAASAEVIFPGAIYDKQILEALRFYSLLYMHGHQVGGTNPSLLEALGAGNPVLAHGNQFNRWVAGEGARYFSDEDSCASELDIILGDIDARNSMVTSSKQRYEEVFTWDKVLGEYEALLVSWHL